MVFHRLQQCGDELQSARLVRAGGGAKHVVTDIVLLAMIALETFSTFAPAQDRQFVIGLDTITKGEWVHQWWRPRRLLEILGVQVICRSVGSLEIVIED